MNFIAELCQNHNGDFDNVKRMVDSAAEGGATHIKIQHIYSKNLVFRPQFEEGLVVEGNIKSIKRPFLSEYKRLKSLELSSKECSKFVKYVEACGLVPMTTCFARGDMKSIIQEGFKVIKVASYDCASFQLIKELTNSFDELFISTGASFDDEIKYTNSLLVNSASKYHLLHCITQYPTPLDMMNLNRIKWLNKLTGNVGFSDHSLVSQDRVIAAKAAIYCGAKVVERHFTIEAADATKDGPVSINKNHIQELMGFSKLSKTDQKDQLDSQLNNWEIMLGKENRMISDNELLNRDYYRGRFATPRYNGRHESSTMIFNWDEVPINNLGFIYA